MLLMMTGCATTPKDCDPRKGGFIQGLSCQWSGDDQKRVTQLEETRSEVTDIGNRLTQQNTVLVSEHEETSNLLAEEQQKLALLEGNINTLETQIANLQAKSKREKNQKKALSGKLSRLSSRFSTLKRDSRNLKASLSKLNRRTTKWQQKAKASKHDRPKKSTSRRQTHRPKKISSAKSLEYQRAKRENQRLRKEMDFLMKEAAAANL